MKFSYFAFILVLLSNVSFGQSKHPNIIVILADDLGYGDLKIYNPESQVKTPHLDRLAAKGLRFTDAHSGSAVCTPTRYGLLTGRYAFRSALKKGVLGGFSPMLIEKDRMTIADMFKQAGYETGVVGKWHLGLGWQTTDGKYVQTTGSPDKWPDAGDIDITKPLQEGPNDLGFDYSYIIPASLDIPPYVYLQNGKATVGNFSSLSENHEPRGVFWRAGAAGSDFKIEETLDHLTKKATQFITSKAKSEKPFFLYSPLTSPHTPWLPGKSFAGTSGAGTYGDFVAHTDAAVGKIIHTLDSLGITDNTLIVFTSDNGADWKPGDKKAFPAHKANGIFRGEKSDIWEGGHRVPFLIHWPGGLREDVVSQTVCLTDLFATFAKITGVKLPANTAQDSFDFSILLKQPNSRKPVRPTTIHHSIEGMFAIRSGKWKFIDGEGSGGWSKDVTPGQQQSAQLYDLDSDPAEQVNLLEQNPKVGEELKQILAQQKAAGFTRPGAKP